MAMTKCPECGKEVSDTAKTCPHCGHELPQKPNVVAGIFILGAIFLIALFYQASSIVS